MSPIGPHHNGVVNWLNQALVRAIGDRGIVQVHGPVRLDDFAVLRPCADFCRERHPRPEDVLLVIEMSDSSLRFDRAIKRPLYARHGIAEYWIVDLPGEAVELCRAPTEHGYGSVVRVGRDRTVSLECLPDVTISVGDRLG
jgi:Uma2 family endonuclease